MSELQEIMDSIELANERNGIPPKVYRSSCINEIYRSLRKANVDLEELDRRLSEEFKQEEEVLEGLQGIVKVSGRIALFQKDDYDELLDPIKGIVEGYTRSELDIERFVEIVKPATEKLKEIQKEPYGFDIDKGFELKKRAAEEQKRLLTINLFESFMKQTKGLQDRAAKVIREFLKEAPEAKLETGPVKPYFNETDREWVTERTYIEFGSCPNKVAGYVERQEDDWSGRNGLKNRIRQDVWDLVIGRIHLIPELQKDKDGNERYSKNVSVGTMSPSKGRKKFIRYTIEGSQVVPSVIMEFDTEGNPFDYEQMHYKIRNSISLNAADEDDMVNALATIMAYKPALDELNGVKKVLARVPRKGIRKLIPKYETEIYVPSVGNPI